MAEIENVESKLVKQCAKSLKPLTEVYKREENSIIRRLRNKYSSLLFRDLISTHAGIVWNDKLDNLGNYGIEERVETYLHDSIVVSIPACHAGDRGSIPRRGVSFYKMVYLEFNLFKEILYIKKYNTFKNYHEHFRIVNQKPCLITEVFS